VPCKHVQEGALPSGSTDLKNLSGPIAVGYLGEPRSF
jgi:hypothetical protein